MPRKICLILSFLLTLGLLVFSYWVTNLHCKKHGIFYVEGLNLVRKSIVLTFDILANDKYDDDGNIVWYNLRMELLDDSIPEMGAKGSKHLWENSNLTKNRQYHLFL